MQSRDDGSASGGVSGRMTDASDGADLERSMPAVVLAAGVGSRLDPLTRLVPKPLVPFVNLPVMEHLQRLLRKHGIVRTISNVHHLPEKVPAYFGDGRKLSMDMNYVHELNLSGDAGGVRACRAYLDSDTFLVVMGDLVTDMDISYLVRQHKEKGALATIALKQVSDVERFGIAVVNKDGFIRDFQEKPLLHEARSNLASTGVYVFEPAIFDYIAEAGEAGFGRDVFPHLLEKNLPLLGVEVYGYWSDVGTIGQYRSSTFDAVQGLIDLDIPGERDRRGWISAYSSIGRGCLIDGALVLGANSEIGNGVCVKGYAVIGENCSIAAGAVLEDVIVWSGTTIGASAKLKNTVVGNNVQIAKNSTFSDATIVEPVRSSEMVAFGTLGTVAPTQEECADPPPALSYWQSEADSETA